MPMFPAWPAWVAELVTEGMHQAGDREGGNEAS